MVRAQRILAGIELFALALWSGGLFFLLFIALPGISASDADDYAAQANFASACFARFGPLEIILGLAILASNFVKLVTFPKTGELQRMAVLAATMLLVVSIACQASVRPKLDDLRNDLQSPRSAQSITSASESARLMEKKHINLLRAELIGCLFLLYAYRVFEERKLRSLLNVLTTKQP
jgi:hypothetical protein